MQEQRLMKSGLDIQAITRLAQSLQKADPSFPVKAFTESASAGLDKLELKQRVQHLISVLHRYLPSDFESAAVILSTVKLHWDWGDREDPLRGFAAWPLIDYIAEHGLHAPRIALPLLAELTPLFSAEFAIRPFITEHFALTYSHLQEWCQSPEAAVRRLASEGVRPRLPWGSQLRVFIDDPSPVLALLEQLKDDQSDYVRRSVANNLNDISKDHPKQVIRLCRRWQRDASRQRHWIIRHATRSLVKSGMPEAFALLGYTCPPVIKVSAIQISSSVIYLGQDLKFAFTLKATGVEKQHMVVDYAVHHIKANGDSRAKVFKFKSLTLAAGDDLHLQKSHPFKSITTRKYYTGTHKLVVLVNGIAMQTVSFELIVP